MPLYRFSCVDCGGFDQSFSMSTVPAAVECPACEAPSRRGFAVAGLLNTGSQAARLIEATTRTASEPAVVGAPIGRGGAPVTRNPLHRKLPRP
ncbi:FmdB family zinc ribbon protein [Nocardia camponoti]|uniref:FmdB family zinc ribbon protein n=1 Tax=Nocardia camponoti TaxID=1616106 RepID=UPI00166BF638|nr:zinc ribbon domain-containing protein [Nocardia camponoti]